MELGSLSNQWVQLNFVSFTLKVRNEQLTKITSLEVTQSPVHWVLSLWKGMGRWKGRGEPTPDSRFTRTLKLINVSMRICCCPHIIILNVHCSSKPEMCIVTLYSIRCCSNAQDQVLYTHQMPAQNHVERHDVSQLVYGYMQGIYYVWKTVFVIFESTFVNSRLLRLSLELHDWVLLLVLLHAQS